MTAPADASSAGAFVNRDVGGRLGNRATRGLRLLAVLVLGVGTLPASAPAALARLSPPAPSTPTNGGAACAALPPPTGTIIDVGPAQAGDLPGIVAGAASGTTIRLADGVYNLSADLWFTTPSLTLRSGSSNRDAVVLDGGYGIGEPIAIVASNVTIADLTVEHAYWHNIHIAGGSADTDHVLIHNVHVLDAQEQQVKVNPNNGHFTDFGELRCSRIEITDSGRPLISNNCYTGGIDAHQSQGWKVDYNVFSGIWCPSGLPDHSIHFWTGSRDTLIDSNVILNPARAIGLGLDADAWRIYPDNPCPGAAKIGHIGGLVRNNFIAVTDDRVYASTDGFDTGIGMEHACGGPVVVHNSVSSTQAPRSSSIEWRFPETDAVVKNNIATASMIGRDGGSAVTTANLESAGLDHFVDAAAGDLHLAATATDAIKHGVVLPPGVCDFDIDGDARTAPPDIGADERVQTVTIPPGAYNPVVPHRVLDTRSGSPLGEDSSLDVQIAGQGGVPSSGAVAVVLNVTVTEPTAPSYLTVYPTAVGGRPLVSNLNFVPGQTMANLVEVALGQAGRISAYNSRGGVHVIMDVQGYVGGTGPAGLFHPLASSTRLLDTRLTGQRLPPGGSLQLTVPGAGVEATVLNVTAVDGTAASYLSVYPGTGAPPLASNVNFPAHSNVPNPVSVKPGPGGVISVYNSVGNVDVVVDRSGDFGDGSDVGGTLFHPLAPQRILDTRQSAPLNANSTLQLAVAGQGGIPASSPVPVAVVMNVTATEPTSGSYLTVYPSGASRPLASDLNFGPSATVPNLVVVGLGSGAAAVYNNLGSVHVLADVSGWYG